jgi:dihydrofolate reductase
VVVHSLAEAFTRAEGDAEVFVFGGADIYRQALPRAQRMYLTLVHAQVPGDTFFPEFDWKEWRELERVRHESDAKHAHPYSFVTLERKQKCLR